MNRLLSVCSVGVLVLASCSGADDAPSPFGTPSSGTPTTTLSPATTVAPPSSTTTAITVSPTPFPPDPYVDLPVIVAADDGIYEVAPSGVIRKLLDGSVAFAVDDAAGGVLYQVDRGRNWLDMPDWDTRVWWLPPGETRPQELLVPSPGHELTLHDTYLDTGLHVVYTRHESPPGGGSAPHGLVGLLRGFDVDDRQAVDLASGSEWEAGLARVSCGAGLISFTRFGQIGGECEFVDGAGTPVRFSPAVSDLGCESDCRIGCALGWNGELLVYTQDLLGGDQHTDVVFVHSQTGAELGRLSLAAELGRPESIDILGNRFLVSYPDGRPASLHDLADLDADPFVMPISGIARFVRGPLPAG